MTRVCPEGRGPRVLVTGAGGLLGGRLAALLAIHADVVAGWHEAPPPVGLRDARLDVLSRASIESVIDAVRPGAIVHCAALADVDRCEAGPEAARRLNVGASETLARSCRSRGIRLVTISTDLVHAGDRRFVRETDPPGPLMAYAVTKLEGEEAVLAHCPGAAIVRVALVLGRGHGPRGTASESIAWGLRAGSRLRLFTDQYRTPVDPESVSRALERLLEGSQAGRFHLGGAERLSRHELGVRVARLLGLREDLIEATTQATHSIGVPRPADVSLDSGRAARELGWAPRPLDDAIREGRVAPDGRAPGAIIRSRKTPMERESLEDRLRRATRNFTTRLPEDELLRLGADLSRELARAHADSPPRHPDLEPKTIPIVEGKPRLEGGAQAGDAEEDLFRLGALLNSLATGAPPDVSWRLDGPPRPDASTLARATVLSALGSPRREDALPGAGTAAEAIEAALAPPEDGPAPWPLFRGDPARSGSRDLAASPSAVAATWQVLLGSVVASPALTARLALAALADGRLVFLDRGNGRKLLEIRLASAIESSPALLGRDLYVGTDDGDMVAVDVVEGRERFRAKVGQLVRSSPLPLADHVLVGVVDGKDGGGLVAVDTKGKTLWKRKLGPVFSSPALAGDRVLVGSDDGSLHAVDPAKGTVLWSHPLGAKVRATPAVSGEIGVVGDFSGRLAAVRVADGSRVWTAELGHPVYSSACLAGELCLVGCNEGHIHALDLRTGAPRFEVRTGGPVVASALGVGGRFLVASTDGDVYLLDAGGSVVHRSTVSPAGLQASPAADGELVVLGSGAGLHALRLAP